MTVRWIIAPLCAEKSYSIEDLRTLAYEYGLLQEGLYIETRIEHDSVSGEPYTQLYLRGKADHEVTGTGVWRDGRWKLERHQP